MYGHEPIYNEFADKTDSVMVVPYQNAYINGVWKYFEKGVVIKEEKWNMGVLDTVFYFSKLKGE